MMVREHITIQDETAALTPFDIVLQHYQFPEKVGPVDFIPHPLQIETINELAPLTNSGEWLAMATGKTFVSTACALYWRITSGATCLAIMPPLLVAQWARWLRLLRPKLSITEYVGTPAQRKKLDLDADFVLVGVQIFKRDYERFQQAFEGRICYVIIDEAMFVSNINSDNHQKVYDFCIGRPQALLTGTLGMPMHAYGLLKFTAPGRYRSMKHFENLHVEERDFFDNPIKYQNLELLAESLAINSKRILYEDMYSGVETPLYDPIEYDLAPEHMRLYHRLAEEQLLKLPDGGKIDATTAGRLRHALGQIILNWGHFAGDPSKTSIGIEMIQQKLDELGDGKLVVFSNYRLTIANICANIKGALPINSQVSPKQKQENIDRFIEDPGARLLVVQFISGSKGLDGLQHVCHQCMFIEPCTSPDTFHQAVARLRRPGQRHRVHVMMPTAVGTLQVRGFTNLLNNDEIANKVVRNSIELREEIFGR